MREKPHEQAVCARCGAAIDLAESYRVASSDGAGAAEFCRLEHIVSWLLRGGQWQLERPWEVEPHQRVAAGPLTLFRRREGVVIERRFDSPDALSEWAAKGGFWAS